MRRAHANFHRKLTSAVFDGPSRRPELTLMDALLALVKPAVLRTQSLVLRVTRGVTFGVRGLVSDGERVLLVRHTYVPGWYLPGGAVEPGETALASLARELDEEAAVAYEGEPSLHGLFFNQRMAARDHVAVYHVRAWRELRPFAPSREIRDMQVFPVNALPADATDATRQRVAEMLGTRPVSPYW
jgi:ADP-ribose pyrophosphatase YjhB (NUDIX family)